MDSGAVQLAEGRHGAPQEVPSLRQAWGGHAAQVRYARVVLWYMYDTVCYAM